MTSHTLCDNSPAVQPSAEQREADAFTELSELLRRL